MRPNFLIVGAAKCGTTSVYAWLKAHPEVFFPEMKEPCFFIRDYGINDWNSYESLFRGAEGKKIIGDASAGYLSSPESPTWIKEALGREVKILILVRNPVERAFSLYKWMTMEGYEAVFPFEKALALEEFRFADGNFRTHSPQFFADYMYVRTSLYSENIIRYLDTFGHGATRIHVFDDLIRDPNGVYDDICDFLEIEKGFRPPFTHENKGVVPRSVALQSLLKKNVSRITILPPVGRLWRAGVLKLMELNKELGRDSGLLPATRRGLVKCFADDVTRLGALLGRDLSHWLAA